jgi:hypothetical protein
VEILLLSGGTPYANFQDLAFAWGKENGFHVPLASAVCERHHHPTSTHHSACTIASSGKGKQAQRNSKRSSVSGQQQLPLPPSTITNNNMPSNKPVSKRTKRAEV